MLLRFNQNMNVPKIIKNKTKFIWIYDREKSQYKATAHNTTNNKATEGHTRQHTAIQYRDVPQKIIILSAIFCSPLKTNDLEPQSHFAFSAPIGLVRQSPASLYNVSLPFGL